MAEKLQFELVSPEKLLLSEAVAMVVVPGSEGNFGVLPGHALLISTVRPGVIDVYADEPNAVSERIFVSGGFAEVTPVRCTVLADEAVPMASLDRGDLEQQQKSLESGVAGLREQVARFQGADRDRAAAELRAAERRLAVASAKLAALAAIH
ncbi:MAG TPA: ATP synthase F1 subunit epsilon [Stellaceae bacterium]|jgi:F-type H+-transporting ATPase subunit epsilon|nr:ATP synthase F1 subunit epsilon [Stellaceae bacterium]